MELSLSREGRPSIPVLSLVLTNQILAGYPIVWQSLAGDVRRALKAAQHRNSATLIARIKHRPSQSSADFHRKYLHVSALKLVDSDYLD
jgi:hypothetical protein